MYTWIAELAEGQTILDVASGPGSFARTAIRCQAILLDEDVDAFQMSGPLMPGYLRVFGRSHQIPLQAHSIDLVVCHHALEHIEALDETLREIARVLKPDGRLFVSVPNGHGLCDGLYRFFFDGGGHVQRFERDALVRRVEEGCGLQLTRWSTLFSSFVYLRRLADLLQNPPPGLCGRLAFLARFPSGWLRGLQRLVYSFARTADHTAGSHFSVYGWALYFEPSGPAAAHEPGFVNVCLNCGTGHPAEGLERPSPRTFRCQNCSFLGPYFAPHGPHEC